MKRALVFFNSLTDSIGGSECLAFAVLRELQASCEITFALGECSADPREVSARYGIDVDWNRVKVVDLRPTGFLACLDRHLKFVRWTRLRALAKQADFCVSCSNPVDFGRPALHFVFMMSFDRPFHAWAQGWDLRGLKFLRHCLVVARDSLVFLFSRTRTPRQILRDSRETVLPNSAFVREKIEAFYRCRTGDVFYPPTLFATDIPNAAPRESIGYLGRICPEKRILELVEIVRRARETSGRDLSFHVAGVIPDDACGRALRELAAANPWLVLHGPVTGEAKKRFLASVSLAVHGRASEEFGIALTEYLKAGVVPVVPRTGGAAEVVDNPALGYGTDDEAVAILVRLVSDDAFFSAARSWSAVRASAFSADAYFVRQSAVLRRLMAGGGPKVYLTVTPFFPTADNWRGGFCLDLVKRLSESPGFSHLVAVPWPGDFEIEGVRVVGFRERHLPGDVFPSLLARWNVRTLLRALARAGVCPADVSVCHAHTARYGRYALALKRLSPRCRTILHHHDPACFGLNAGRIRHCWLLNVFRFLSLRKMHERMDHHVFVSEMCRKSMLAAPDASWSVYDDYRRQMRGLGFLRSPRLKSSEILHNVVGARFAKSGGIRRNEEAVIGCVGNFVDWKDQITLLRAVVKLASVRLRLVFVGTGPLRQACETYAKERNLDATFVDAIPREEMPAFYRQLDLFVLPSYFEAFGCVFAEAKACGVPFITCEGQGMDDLVPPAERERWLCRPRDPDDLAKKISAFLVTRSCSPDLDENGLA